MNAKRNGWWLVCLCALASLFTGRALAESVETWQGEMELPGMKMELVVRFTLPEKSGSDPVTATIDIPAQGAMGLPLSGITYNDDELKFAIALAGARFELKRNGDSAEGKLMQAGQTYPVTLRRLTPEEAEATETKRPQTPKPPFPYAQEEVTFENPDDGTHLAGTLIIPEGTGPFPAVVFITGSGPQDRDETIFGHKPFLVIADHLARHGIASLRYDDRGMGGSTGKTMESTGFDTAGDVMSAIDLLLKRADIKHDHIGLIGHSEGGIIAPMVAAENHTVDFIVLLAGTGVPGFEVLKDQLRALLIGNGATPEDADAQVARQQELLHRIMDGAPLSEVKHAVEELVLGESGLTRNEDGSIPTALRPAVEQQTAALTSPWFQSFLALDPRKYLRQVNQPVLALNGSLDFQVDADRNLPEIEKALKEGGNGDVTVRKLEGLNHLFQMAQTGMMNEYGAIEETISPKVLDMITAWIRDHTGSPAAPTPVPHDGGGNRPR